jgi:proteasome lid subunit RPN8/RPN11
LYPADLFRAPRAARGNGHAIVGCYHSHPGGRARPSAADAAGAGEENFLWLIAGEEGLAAFVYSRGGFTGADWVTSSE